MALEKKEINIIEYPHIKTYRWGEEEKLCYISEYKDIQHLVFDTQKEVALANAMYLNLGDDFSESEFKGMIQCIFRILNVKSEWQ